MNLKKSTKILLAVILFLVVGIILTKYAISDDRWLYYKISTISDSNKQIEKSLVDLDGLWFVKPEDSLSYSYPSFNDENWTSYRNLYLALLTNGKKVCWLRKHFVAPSQISDDTLILRLSLYDTPVQVYVNGTKVADSCLILNRTVCCFIPAKCLIKGKRNLIAIRSHSMVPIPANNLAKLADEIVAILHPTINLAGVWKFSKGDQENWKNKEFNDSFFKPIVVPKYWDEQGYKNYLGFGWYRKTFTIPSELRSKKLVFLAGKIDDFGEVYINGIKIGGHVSKIMTETEYDTYCLYPFNGNLLTDSNTVAIRVFNNIGAGGIYQAPIGIMTMDDYLKFINHSK